MVDRMMHDRIRRLTLDGHTAAYIARELGCSTKTVDRVRNPGPRAASEPRSTPAGPAKTPLQSARIFAAAAALLTTPSLGPHQFRAAIATWLNENGTVTKRLELQNGGNVAAMLPCVLAILDVIEAAR